MENNTEKLNNQFVCSLCLKTFSTKGNLTRHCSEVHLLPTNVKEKPRGKFNCIECGTTYSTKANLTRHCKIMHCSENYTDYECPACDNFFTRTDSLYRHIDKNHKDQCETCSVCKTKFSDLKSFCKHKQEELKSLKNKDKNIAKNFKCEDCGCCYTSKSNFNRHMEKIHNIDNKKSPTLKCPMCDAAFQTMTILDQHLSEKHDLILREENVEFNSMEDFKNWKEDIEKEDLAFFNCKSSSKNRIYYECHRSGLARTANSVAKLKSNESIKIGKICPARLIVTNCKGRIHLHCQRTHVGHDQTICLLHSKEKKKNKLVGKINIDVPSEINSNEIIQSFQSQSVHDENSVSPLNRLQSLLNIALSTASVATDEAVLEAAKQQEKIIEILRQNPADEKNTTSNYLNLDFNLPSHKNLENELFHPTKKEQVLTELTTLDRPDKSSEVIHIEFDHSYDSNPFNKTSTR